MIIVRLLRNSAEQENRSNETSCPTTYIEQPARFRTTCSQPAEITTVLNKRSQVSEEHFQDPAKFEKINKPLRRPVPRSQSDERIGVSELQTLHKDEKTLLGNQPSQHGNNRPERGGRMRDGFGTNLIYPRPGENLDRSPNKKMIQCVAGRAERGGRGGGR